MVIKVWNGPTEPTLYVKAVQVGKEVRLIAVDHKGQRKDAGNLCAITQDGYLQRYMSVNSQLGLQLDGNRRVKLLPE